MESKIIGSRISAARKKLNLTQSQLAEQLFISPQAVGKWERGESIPDIVTVGKLAKVLSVDLNYFADGKPDPGTGSIDARPVIQQAATAPAVERPGKRGRDMSRFIWADADFSGLKDLHEKLSECDIRNCKFIGSDLTGLLLRSNHIEGCDFRGSDMSKSRIQNSHVANVLFNDCVLKEAEFAHSTIKGCDLSGAELTGATVRMSEFQKCTMTNAVLQRTVFQRSDITEVVFEGVLDDCSFDNCSFSKVTFRNATLLNTFFKSRNLKRVRFEACKADRMTFEFLKNGKADVSGIEVME